MLQELAEAGGVGERELVGAAQEQLKEEGLGLVELRGLHGQTMAAMCSDRSCASRSCLAARMAASAAFSLSIVPFMVER